MFLCNPKVYLTCITFFLVSFTFAQESSPGDCSDGIDNDGDNLIDYYDDDCPCEGENFFGTCASACSATTFPSTQFSVAEQWRSDNINYPFDNRQVAMVADIDADGYPDVVVKNDGLVNTMYVFDGRDGSHKLTINAPAAQLFNIGIAIADVDGDGFGEIIMNTSDKINSFDYKRRLVCYEHNGTQKWISDKQTGNVTADGKLVPGIADFNGDGTPEVFIGNEVYNALTGAFIASGSSSTGVNSATSGEAFSSAVDVLSSGACANCGGLELVAGNEVYSVDVSGGSLNLEVTAPVGIPDGFTAVADIDLDNDYDAVVTSGGKVYAWDLQTSTQIGNTFTISDASAATSNSPAGGLANIADFNGDGTIEVGLAGKNVYVVIDYNSGTNTFEELWSLYVKDGSGRTGSTVFDFEGDGASEVIYKAQEYLWVLDGTTGAIKAQISCGSGTRTDYPLVVDVDADGATEIVCSCSDVSGPKGANSGYLIAFEATDRPWVHARQVWNQFQYNITNINDDLSIPANPQKGFYLGTKFNNYLSQAPILDEFGDYVIDAADLVVEIIGADVSNCGSSQIDVTVKVSNQGSAIANSNTPISFYEEDPTGLSGYIGTGYTTIDLDNSESEEITVSLNVSNQPNEFNLYAVVNSTLTSTPFSYSTDFPAGPIPECDYTNNTDNAPTGCCGISNAGEIEDFEQNCSSFDPAEIVSINDGGDVCASGSVYSNSGTNNADRLNYSSGLSGLNGTDPAFSFEVWTRPIDATSTATYIILDDAPNIDVRFQLTNAEKFRLRINSVNYICNTALTIGDWHHIVATYSSNTINFYIDGVLDRNFTATESANAGNSIAVQIGKKEIGELDNFKIYDSALTLSEVNEAMNNCKYSKSGSLIHHWNFDVNTGTNDAIDLVGNADLSFGGTAPSRTTPGGGLPNSGTVSYEWEFATNESGPWTTIGSSDLVTYNPTTISTTTFYRRGIINENTCANSYTNIVEKRIATGLDDGGTIGSNEEACSGFDSAEMTELTAPAYSTNTEPTKTYQWQSSSSEDGPWSDIGGATSISYDPGAINTTTYFKRIVSESGCSETFSSNVIEKKNIASTFFESGSISGEEAGCPAYTPTTIIGTDPSGSYNFIYQWQSSTDGTSFSDMSGETGSDLSFSNNLLTTTHYRRLISESGCTVYNLSNTVVKFVKTEVTNGGTLSSDESECGTFDPAIITSSGPIGGGPSYEYIWESTDAPGNTWITVGGATADSYDPGSITVSNYYRVGVRSVGPSCTEYTYTDPISKEVFSSGVEENEISGDEFNCGSFDPNEITDEESPESDTDYQWEFTTDLSGSWTEIVGATNLTYDPTTISATTFYRRKVRETGCTVWQEPLSYVTKNIDCDCGSGSVYLQGSNSVKVATDTCSSGVWSYYYDPTNPSQLLFGIEHYPSGGNTNAFDAEVTINTSESLDGTTAYADSVFFKEDLSVEEAIYVMGRYWNIDLIGGVLDGVVNIRFFYDERESARIENLAEGWKESNGATPNLYTTSGLIWFKTIGESYTPNSQIIASGLNVDKQVLTPAEYGYLNGVKYVQFDGLTSFSGGTAAVRVGLNPVLPVELLSFSGYSDGPVNRLVWKTESENETSHFIVERKGVENQFHALSDPVNALGNSLENITYRFVDEQPRDNIDNYYRLKIVDEDGSFKYSDVIVITTDATTIKDKFNVFPNPADDLLNFEFSNNISGKVQIRIIDITGKLMYKENQSVAKGILTQGRFNLSHFTPGAYIIQVVSNVEVRSSHFIVQ